MFSPVSLSGKKSAVKAAAFLFVVLCLTAPLFIGCNLNGDDDISLEGYWKSSFGDGFEISGTAYTQYDDAAKSVSFAGIIVNAPDLSAPAGSLTIKITNPGSWYKTKDYFYIIKWKDLSEKGVRAASAGIYLGEDDPGNDFAPGMPTQTEAEEKYAETPGNSAANYFAIYGEYTKQ
jgi:hypothetical protein